MVFRIGICNELIGPFYNLKNEFFLLTKKESNQQLFSSFGLHAGYLFFSFFFFMYNFLMVLVYNYIFINLNF